MSSEYGWDAPPRGRDANSNPRSRRGGGSDRVDGERLADVRADDPYGYGADGYGGHDGYEQGYAGYDGYPNGAGYDGNGYAEDGTAGYENGQYAADGYNGYGGNGQDPYAARDPYTTGDVYGAPDAYASADPRTSGQHSVPDPYLTGGDQYDNGSGYADGYGPEAAYGGQDGYGQNAFPGQDPYGSQAATGYGRGGGYDDQDYGWRDSRPHDAVDDPGLTRRRRAAAGDEFDADDARHDGFFRGFGGGDDDFPGNRRRSGGGRRPAKQGGSKAGLVALAIVVIVFAGIAGVGYHYYSAYKARHASYPGPGFGSATILVKNGDTFDSISSQLLAKHVILAIDPWASYVAGKQNLQPGTYKIHMHMSPAETYAALTNAKNMVRSKVTIPDGYRVTRILPLLAKESGLPLSNFQAAAKDTAALGLPSYAHGNLEGYLYPDTYFLEPGETALKILQAAVAEFNNKVASLHLRANAPQVGYTAAQIITGASLLEGEVGPQYFGQVARVIDNRIQQGMDLQFDSTVLYALNLHQFKLTSSQLATPSPYNTFLHADLPPGPIDSPDIQAIEAFLHPPHGDWLYFITVDKKGTTRFTNSFSQFQIWHAQAVAAGVA